VVLLVSVHSSIEVYGHVLLWVHMIQHLLLIMVVPVLLIWGQPVRLGDWLESARRQSLAKIGSTSGDDHNTVGASADIDDDEEARQAYNRMLAELNRRSSPGSGG